MCGDSSELQVSGVCMPFVIPIPKSFPEYKRKNIKKKTQANVLWPLVHMLGKQDKQKIIDPLSFPQKLNLRQQTSEWKYKNILTLVLYLHIT